MTVYKSIVDAAKRGEGLQLSPADVRTLLDHCLSIANDDERDALHARRREAVASLHERGECSILARCYLCQPLLPDERRSWEERLYACTLGQPPKPHTNKVNSNVEE